MKKNITYREKLLELANIYSVTEIKNYRKNKKNLTTSQLIHLLKKNKVPIPTEINKSIIEIHSKKIIKPFNDFGRSFTNFINSYIRNLVNFTFYIAKFSKNIITSIFFGVLNFFRWINKSTIDLLNNIYNLKVPEKKINKTISIFSTVILVSFIFAGGFQLKNFIGKNKEGSNDVILKEKLQKKQEVVKTPEKKLQKKQEVVKTPEKKLQEKQEVVKTPEKKLQKKQEVVKTPKKDISKEFVLPDLNLKTETVLSLFNDVEYDLKKVRKNKLVKPIYFTQFPKDLDEITNIQLKKETFIKIVLPLVVAENQKILDDKLKLRRISKKKMTSDEEKSWLRQKFKEYKVKNGSVDELIKRMDIIPVSIAISQAAKESGWGTSRFALEGNAIFGQWTWNGRGIEPLERAKKQSHKVLRFPILRASVKAYKNNLNTHKSYKEFRDKRYDLRRKNRPIIGLKLIHTLESYAQTGAEYTKNLAKMIEQNSLDDFENVKLTNYTDKKELDL